MIKQKYIEYLCNIYNVLSFSRDSPDIQISFTMKTFTRPKIFRSTEGCCICKAKSSRYEILTKYLNVRLTTRPFTRSSRFTDSEKYEDDFAGCFQLAEERSGEICNACVLVVKRWRKLPRRKIR